MSYIPNPKLVGSGMLGCIPQQTRCPNNCPDCFFQSGRSYLEPLSDNLPNMPPPDLAQHRVVRVNDGHDSNIGREHVIQATECYPHRFFNTSIPQLTFPAPVVLTVNPDQIGDHFFHRLGSRPNNLMFVRVRVNTWNLHLVHEVVEYYTAGWDSWRVPIVFTFMRYYETPVPKAHLAYYAHRQCTMNYYWAITTGAWEGIMDRYKYNRYVYSCGTEGEMGTTLCRHCGNCLREYYATLERMA